MTLAVLVAILLLVGTPHAGRLSGWWIFPALELALLVVIAVRDPGRIDDRSRTVRRLTIGLIAVMTVGTLAAVVVLVHDILVTVPGVSGVTLLARGGAVWFTNVIVFSLWYWELDRGGPAERAAGSGVPLSFAFPENAMPAFVASDWQPRYPDYLYLAFTNATAFSPTDTMPVRIWAKMTMLLQAAISLVTGILVIARAINDLPG